MEKNDNLSTMIMALRTNRKGLWNDNKPWSPEDVFQLNRLFYGGVGLSAIALELGRTELSVTQKAAQTGLFADETRPRRPNCKEECQCGKCPFAFCCQYYEEKLADEAEAENESGGTKKKKS